VLLRSLFDMVRLDHFRGFESTGRSRRRNDRYSRALDQRAGRRFSVGTQNAFCGLPIVAETFGVITPPVEKLRQQFGLRA